MGARVNTTSTAIDNRLAVTDQGFGISSSGNGNSVAVSLLDNGAINRAFDFAETSRLLDSGAVNRAFNFAETSLSGMLASFIDGQKTQAAAQQQAADTVGSALKQAAQANATAQRGALDSLRDSFSANFKKLLIGGAIAAGAWYLLKGRKA